MAIPHIMIRGICQVPRKLL